MAAGPPSELAPDDDVYEVKVDADEIAHDLSCGRVGVSRPVLLAHGQQYCRDSTAQTFTGRTLRTPDRCRTSPASTTIISSGGSSVRAGQ